MEYRYTDGHITVSQQEAFRAFKNGADVRIGYQHKDHGAYWNFKQFKDKESGNTAREKFNSIVEYVRYNIIPHTRLKYTIKE
jgi:hypothetical protein